MRFPKLQAPDTLRSTQDVFLGLNMGSRPAEGEFADMENLTSDHFPLLSPRGRRGIAARPEACRGMIAKDTLCYADGSRFVMDGYAVEMGLSDAPKQMVSMGAYVVIFPDRKYINTADLTDHGSLEASWESNMSVLCTPADLTGTERLPDYVQAEEPAEPENMALWLDTGSEPPALMQWSAVSGLWAPAAEIFVKLSCPGIGAAFREYDGVTVSGLEGKAADLNGSNVIWARDTDWILVPGVLEQSVECSGAVTVERRVPEMDFVTECGNRLWGCRYGVNGQGQPVNEIYASKLGDFRNWNCFMGLSTDSYAVSLGEDGAFTGAVNHMGYPVFFRENCLHKIYGSYPAAFRLQTTPCRGVQRGSSESIALLGAVLYYKSVHGVCAYDGSLPVEVSQALGTEHYFGAAAGTLGGKYYISMCSAGGEYRLFVYDSLRKLWHREDDAEAKCFCTCREELYFLDSSGVIRSVGGTGAPEGPVHWMAQTGDLGLDTADSKYLSRLTLRLKPEHGSTVTVKVRYDDSPRWEQAAVIRGSKLGTVKVPLPVRRCDHAAIRLEGTGDAKVYSITRTITQGSDVS